MPQPAPQAPPTSHQHTHWTLAGHCHVCRRRAPFLAACTRLWALLWPATSPPVWLGRSSVQSAETVCRHSLVLLHFSQCHGQGSSEQRSTEFTWTFRWDMSLGPSATLVGRVLTCQQHAGFFLLLTACRASGCKEAAFVQDRGMPFSNSQTAISLTEHFPPAAEVRRAPADVDAPASETFDT